MKVYCRSVVDIILPSERAHQDGSNAPVKGCLATLKDIAHVIRATTQKSNLIKYHEVSIPYLYLIN
jgi:hypothetical protein